MKMSNTNLAKHVLHKTEYVYGKGIKNRFQH